MAETTGCGRQNALRTVFFGTPHFASTTLQILHAWPGCQIAGVFTQPDRKSGRGQKITEGACAALARKLALPLFQPPTLKDQAARDCILELRPDIMVVAAYGLLMPAGILAIAPLGALNVHASLLPALRGAAPVARAIMENWQAGAKTGVSIMQVVEELDAGDVYAAKEVPIGEHTCESLTDLLAREGARLLVETMTEIAAGRAKRVPQNPDLVTWAKKLSREDGEISWNEPTRKIAAQVRGTYPWPGARAICVFSGMPEQVFTICACEVGDACAPALPGTIYADRSGLKIACADNWLRILRLRLPGKKECSGRDFVNGHLRPANCGICGQAR